MNKKFIEKVNNICAENTDKELISYYKDNGSVERWTYGSFRAEVEQIVKQLDKSTIQKGDRVLLLAVLSPEACRMIIALAIFGATCVILDGEQPREELSYLVEKSDIRAVFTSVEYYSKCAKEYEKKYPVYNLSTGYQFCEKTYSLSLTEDPDEEVMAILYSSGTTSEPKGVMITYEGQLNSSKYMLQAFGTTDIRYLIVFPMFHISGFSTFLAIFLGGGQIGLLENVNPTKLLQGFQKYRPNAFGMVPKVYETLQQKIVEQIKQKNSSKLILRLIDFSGWLHKHFHFNIGKRLFESINKQVFGGEMLYLGVGGGLVTKEISDFFLKLGYRWMNTYASTEQNLPMATTTSLDYYPLNAVGKVNRFSEINIRIHNQDDKGRGEIQIKSPCRMKGYFRDIEATKQAYDGDYFKTGDIGYIDKKGYLYVTGRSKESIHLQNGEKVSPERIEALYASCISENVVAACVGVKSEGKEYDDIVFFVERNASINEEHMRHDIMEQSKRVGGNFRVSRVLFIDKMPLSTIGKVQRYKLRNIKCETEQKENLEETERSTYKRIIQILEKVGVKEDIKQESILEQDLGIDSLNLFELCVGIENVFHVDLSDCISAQLTVSELCRMVESDKDNRKSTIEYDINKFPLRRHKGDLTKLSLIMNLSKRIRKYHISGSDNFEEGKNYIICSNHASYFDPIWLLVALKNKMDIDNVVTLAAVERSRDSKGFFRMLGGIPVNRNQGTHPEIMYAENCLKEGMNAIIFPEGARTRDGNLMELKKGVIKVSKDTNTPILPIHINGGFEIFPRHKRSPRLFDWKKHKRFELKIDIHSPIFPDDFSEGEMLEQLKHDLKGE